MLPEDAWDEWLDPTNSDIPALEALLVPAPVSDFEMWPVSTAVNSPANNSAELLVPIETRT